MTTVFLLPLVKCSRRFMSKKENFEPNRRFHLGLCGELVENR